jgi:hypothetical protein
LISPGHGRNAPKAGGKNGAAVRALASPIAGAITTSC